MAHVPSGDTALLDLVHFDDALAAAQRPAPITIMQNGFTFRISTQSIVTFWAPGGKSP